jgi:hypothetical protein
VKGVIVLPAQSCAWLHASWRDQHVRIYGSKTDYIFVAKFAAADLRRSMDSAGLQTFIKYIVALYEAKTAKALKGEC